MSKTNLIILALSLAAAILLSMLEPASIPLERDPGTPAATTGQPRD